MTEVYANGRLLELGEIKIPKVFQINDIGEPKDRQLDYTLPFDIPPTPKNLITLEMLGVIGSSSTIPYRQIKAKIVENSIELVPDGVLVVNKKQGNFKAYIYSGNFFLFDKIGSRKMNELDYSLLNHGVNLENYINSFDNIEGYIYALADFGKLDVDDIEINYQVPSIYTHTLWKMIFDEAGVEYYGDIFETDKFKKKLTTMHRGYNSDVDDINNPINITAASESDNFSFNAGSNNYTENINITYPVQNNVYSGYLINIIDSSDYQFSFDLSMVVDIYEDINDSLNFDCFIYLDIVNQNGVIERTIQLPDLQFFEQNNSSENVTGIIPLIGGEKYYFKIRFEYIPLNSNTGTITVNQTVSNFLLENTGVFSVIYFENFIGDISQIDFVKDIMQEFGLIFKKRRNQLAYDFIQVKELLTNRENTLDWSEKLKGESSEDYKLSSYAQSNRFAYNYLESVNNRFADGILKIDNENLPSEKTLITRPYNAPENSTSVLGSSILLNIPFWKIEFNDDGSVKGYKPFQSKNYIAEIKFINTTINYKIGSGVSLSFTGDVPILDFSQLSYSKILDDNYQELKSTLDFNHIKTLDMLLNELDIQNLDLFKTIFLKQYSSDFYINKITYQDSSMKSKVELVKIKKVKTVYIDPNAESIILSAISYYSTSLNNWIIEYTYSFNNISYDNAVMNVTQTTSNTGGSLQSFTTSVNADASVGIRKIFMGKTLNEKAGDYEIKIEKDGVFSNVVTVNIG